MFFLKEGNCGFVLPQYVNMKFIDIPNGSYFGLGDLVAGILNLQEDIFDFMPIKNQIKRILSARCEEDTELFFLPLEDLDKMKLSFHKEYLYLMENAIKRLDRCLKIKIEAINWCTRNEKSSS